MSRPNRDRDQCLGNTIPQQAYPSISYETGEVSPKNWAFLKIQKVLLHVRNVQTSHRIKISTILKSQTREQRVFS